MKFTSHLLLNALVYWSSSTCDPIRPAPPPRPEPTVAPTVEPVPVDAGADVVVPETDWGHDLCARGYERAEDLGCPPAAPRTGTWVEACRNAEELGFDSQADCSEVAVDCVAVRKCFETTASQ